MSEGGLNRDTLYLACTRPALKWGVPVEGWNINFFGTFFVGAWSRHIVLWAAGVPIHFGMKVLTDKNPNFFTELKVWYYTRLSMIGNTLQAAPSRPAQTAAEYPVLV